MNMKFLWKIVMIATVISPFIIPYAYMVRVHTSIVEEFPPGKEKSAIFGEVFSVASSKQFWKASEKQVK
mgnify:CR=1 FL=1